MFSFPSFSARPGRYLVLVCGSRRYGDFAKVQKVIIEYLGHPDGLFLIHGDARGADTFAYRTARDLDIPSRNFAADWDRHGRAAGPIRNQQMINEKPDLVIAFGTGRGTEDTVRRALGAGIPVRRES